MFVTCLKDGKHNSHKYLCTHYAGSEIEHLPLSFKFSMCAFPVPICSPFPR